MKIKQRIKLYYIINITVTSKIIIKGKLLNGYFLDL